jgi:hypothetical protein
VTGRIRSVVMTKSRRISGTKHACDEKCIQNFGVEVLVPRSQGRHICDCRLTSVSVEENNWSVFITLK